MHTTNLVKRTAMLSLALLVVVVSFGGLAGGNAVPNHWGKWGSMRYGFIGASSFVVHEPGAVHVRLTIQPYDHPRNWRTGVRTSIAKQNCNARIFCFERAVTAEQSHNTLRWRSIASTRVFTVEASNTRHRVKYSKINDGVRLSFRASIW